MTQSIRTGIVGCGKVGHLHAAALKSLPQSQFVAAFDGNPQRAREFGEKYSVKPFDSLDEMLAKAKLDAVCICTPHPIHAESAVPAALAGVHVLVEKSLASTLQDCDRILEAGRTGKVRIGTVCQRRFYAPCRRIRDAIDAGKIGTPMLGALTTYSWRDEAYYKSDPWRGKWDTEGGGVLVNQAPHQLDLLQWYMGPIDELSAFWGNLNHPYIEVEDTAIAVLRFKSGGLGQILVSNSQNPALFGKVFVSGSNGAAVGVQTDSGAMFIAGMSNITEPAYNDIWTVPGETANLEKWKAQDTEFIKTINPMEYYHRLQIGEFLDAIMAGREPAITGEDGRKTVEIFTAIYRSQRDGKPVKFPLKAETGRTDMDGRLTAKK
jgi:UDP-N-acetyl-2-amino-2-deoxyglucuronate dehydrogenase